MPTTLPALPRRNAPWTPFQRRTWLAEQRRDHRLLPAPVLWAVYPDKLAWTWDLPNPYKWNVWQSLDGGVSYILVDGYWMYGDARLFAPDGGGEFHFIVGVDATGREVTHRSNAVRPDDAPVPPTLANVGGNFQGTAPVPASVWQFAQSDSLYESGPVQSWVDAADNANADYDLLPPNQAESGRLYTYCAGRYQVAGVWSPWSAVIT